MRDNGYQIAVTFRFNCIQDLQHAKTVSFESIFMMKNLVLHLKLCKIHSFPDSHS